MKQPKIRPIPALNKYGLLTEFIYSWTKDNQDYKIIVPAGFQFEASIPRVAWSILGLTPGHPKVLAAACVHDYIYRYKGNWLMLKIYKASSSGSWLPFAKSVSRKQADKLFFRIMKENGVKKYKRRMAYKAVRWFGGKSW